LKIHDKRLEKAKIWDKIGKQIARIASDL